MLRFFYADFSAAQENRPPSGLNGAAAFGISLRQIFALVIPLKLLMVAVTVWLAASVLSAQAIVPDLHGTFLQLDGGNLRWTAEQWKQEFQAMKAFGMQTLIIQYIVHEQTAFYRSKIFPIFQPCGTYDPLTNLLSLAHKHGFKVWLGLDASSDVKRNIDIAHEVWSRYQRFWHFVEGWYVFGGYGEIGNAPPPSHAVVFSYAQVIPKLKSIASLPVMIAPYFTLDVTPWQLAQGWERLFRIFCPDVMALQDGVGCGRRLTPENIRPYFEAVKTVCDRNKVRLWSDMEIFDIPSGWLPATIDRITAQFASVRDLVEHVVVFEFNHYLSPLRNRHSAKLYEQWQQRFLPKTVTVKSDERQERLRRCVLFLRLLFVSEIGLFREHLGTKVCWVANDNWLAAKALEKFDPFWARKIQQTMKRFSVPVPNRLQALFDPSISVPPFKTTKFTDISTQGEWLIRNEVENGPELSDWHEYADLVCIAAINAAKRKQLDEARRLVAKAAAMWDGKGIVDKATRNLNRYATYKLALLLWAAKEARVKLPFAPEVERRIWQLQADDGGIKTDYDFNCNPVGTQNVETTSLVTVTLALAR